MIYENGLLQAFSEGFELIDIRRDDEYQMKRLFFPHKHIEMQELISMPQNYIEARKLYLLICAKGIRAQKTVEYLRGLGYHQVYYYPKEFPE